MNTPAHLAASLLCWRKEKSWSAAAAVTVGAFLPDAPMFGFYAYQKLIAHSSEREIWSRLYFQEDWQLFFDVFNSIPLMLLLIALSYCCRFRWGMLLAASALLHLCCDLPVHHDDAHRHFLPFTDWRFASPVSYWDPKHHGLPFMLLELTFAVLASLFVSWKGEHHSFRIIGGVNLLLYLLGIVFALVVWFQLN